MATDATGTPTSLGIPKYNTSADAPSGLGFNAAMDAIDALIAARVAKPSGIAPGEAPVWNGASWDRSSVTKVTANGLTGIHTFGSNLTVSAANTDLVWGGGSSSVTAHNITTGGGTLRSVAAPTGGAGARLVLRNTSGSSVTLKHALAGGSGAQLSLRGAVDATMPSGDNYEFVYDGTTWVEVDRDADAAATVVAPTFVTTGSLAANRAVAANTAYLSMIPDITVATSVSRIIWMLGTLVAGNYDVGIYYSDDEATFTRLVSKGSTAQPAASQVITSIGTTTITPVVGRRWYFGIALSSASSIGWTDPGGVLSVVPGFLKAASFPLPASLTGMSVATSAPALSAAI